MRDRRGHRAQSSGGTTVGDDVSGDGGFPLRGAVWRSDWERRSGAVASVLHDVGQLVGEQLASPRFIGGG
ncbi:MAG TPA: hypothetical protein VFC00_19500 [Micromonosporaceae bacterium]|nr:hypothetical protein [Micromonosporaceae bacterium]